MTRIQVVLFDESVDDLAKILIGYVLGMDKEMPHYQRKVEVVAEFLEEVLDANFQSVSVYLRVLNLMPATVKRKLPYRIESFIKMYEPEIEKAMEEVGGIPKAYKPKRVILLDTIATPSPIILQ